MSAVSTKGTAQQGLRSDSFRGIPSSTELTPKTRQGLRNPGMPGRSHRLHASGLGVSSLAASGLRTLLHSARSRNRTWESARAFPLGPAGRCSGLGNVTAANWPGQACVLHLAITRGPGRTAGGWARPKDGASPSIATRLTRRRRKARSQDQTRTNGQEFHLLCPGPIEWQFLATAQKAANSYGP